jgi:hypothetical protein
MNLIEAQQEMAKSDVLVCGKCHNVFHIIDSFQEHKNSNCKKLSAFADSVSFHIYSQIFYNITYYLWTSFSVKQDQKFGLTYYGSKHIFI